MLRSTEDTLELKLEKHAEECKKAIEKVIVDSEVDGLIKGNSFGDITIADIEKKYISPLRKYCEAVSVDVCAHSKTPNYCGSPLRKDFHIEVPEDLTIRKCFTTPINNFEKKEGAKTDLDLRILALEIEAAILREVFHLMV